MADRSITIIVTMRNTFNYCIYRVIVDNPLGVVLDNEFFRLMMNRHDCNKSLFILSLTALKHLFWHRTELLINTEDGEF